MTGDHGHNAECVAVGWHPEGQRATGTRDRGALRIADLRPVVDEPLRVGNLCQTPDMGHNRRWDGRRAHVAAADRALAEHDHLGL